MRYLATKNMKSRWPELCHKFVTCIDIYHFVQIQEEIDGVIGFDRPPTMKDRDLLPYTTATVSEMLRCRPAAPITMRGASRDVNVSKHFSCGWSNEGSL